MNVADYASIIDIDRLALFKTLADSKYADASDMPTKTSDLTNDSGFITSSSVPTGTTTTPLMDGTAAAGSETKWAHGDHRHPTDTTRAAASDLSALQTQVDNLVIPAAATASPLMDGTAAVGTSAKYAKEDHVHPTDTSRAPLASPNLTGTPTAPTATAGTNTTQIATTAFVTAAVNAAQTGAAMFQGTVANESTITGSAYKKGWYWVVSSAGTYVGQTCEVGDMIYAIADKASSYSASDFSVVQTNVDMSLYVLDSDITLATNAQVQALFA